MTARRDIAGRWPSSDEPAFISTAEIARDLRVHRVTVERQILPHLGRIRIGRLWRYNRADYERWKGERGMGPVAPRPAPQRASSAKNGRALLAARLGFTL